DRLSGIATQQYLTQFRQADTDNTGYLDEKKAKASRLYRNLFKAMDRNGDGKLTEKEVTDYIEAYQKIRDKANAACVTLVLSDESRGIFDLLDADRDGRLSVREMRQAPLLLARLGGDKGYITKDDVPRSYRMTIRRGPASAGGLAAAAA